MPEKIAVLLGGKQSEVEVVFDKDGGKPKSPLICASNRGYAPINSFLRGSRGADQLGKLADYLSDTDDGAFVALIDPARRRPPLAVIQSSFGTTSRENFYQRVHGAPHRLWRDFYFRTIFIALDESDRRWRRPEIVMKHPNGGAWNQEAYKVSMEALGFLVDQRELSVEKVHIQCVHGFEAGVRDFGAALESLNEERASGQSPEFRSFEKREIDPAEIEAPEFEGATLFRIPIERSDGAKTRSEAE